jgi:DNA-binding MarR family transcriptional regulator
MSKKCLNGSLPPPPIERKELSDNPVKLCNEISRIFRARMRENCDIDGVMSQPGARLVMSLLAMNDGLKQRELVERTHLRAPTVSVIIRRMVEEGLAEQRPDQKDGRVTRVYLTERGRRTDSENIQKIKSMDARGLRGLSGEECQHLMELLGRIRDNLISDDIGKESEAQ